MTKPDRHQIKYLLSLPNVAFVEELQKLGQHRVRELFSYSVDLVAKANTATK